MRDLAKFLLFLYQKTKVRPPCCRYYPSCSQYAGEALEKYGALHGGFLALKRLICCNPWTKGGFDPVP